MKNLFSIVVIFLTIVASSAFAEPAGKKGDFFTDAQEQYLADHLYLYAYFSQLYVHQKTPEQVAKEHHLSTAESLRYLDELAKIGIIQKPKTHDLSLRPNFLVEGVSTFKEGPLSRKVSRLIIKQTFSKIEADLEKEKIRFATPGFWITEEQQNAYLKELKDLQDKYIDLAIQNRENKTPNARRVSGFMVLIPNWEPSLFSDVKSKE